MAITSIYLGEIFKDYKVWITTDMLGCITLVEIINVANDAGEVAGSGLTLTDALNDLVIKSLKKKLAKNAD